MNYNTTIVVWDYPVLTVDSLLLTASYPAQKEYMWL